MEKKYTTGPWIPVKERDLGLAVALDDEDHTIVAHLSTCNPADAHLISAAPDLLEAGEPFSKVAGELFANNYNDSEIVATFAFNDGTTISLTAGYFFAMRRASSKAYGQQE